MNEETGRAEGGGVTREKKEGKKRYDCRWGHIRANREETERERGGGDGMQQQQQQQQRRRRRRQRNILLGRVGS